MKRLLRGAAALVVGGLGLGGAAQAASVTFTASGTPAALAATGTATFTWSGSGPLTIDLSASGGGAGDYGAGSGLTALFFDLGTTKNLALTPASATITAGSSHGAAGTNLDNPISLDGGNFALLPSGVSLNGRLQATPVIGTKIELALTGLPGGFTLSDISNVTFQFGSAFSDASPLGSPRVFGDATEPATIALLGVGLLGLGYVRRRRS